jgi:hypothetical protein
MNRFFAMMFVLVGLVFAWGCVGAPESVEWDADEMEETEDESTVSEPPHDPAFGVIMDCPVGCTIQCVWIPPKTHYHRCVGCL